MSAEILQDPCSIMPGQEPLIGPGVRGCILDDGEAIWIPVIFAEHPGSGDVSRFLDGLPKNRTIKFPTVCNRRLEGMLARRGFVLSTELAFIDGDPVGPVDVWVRKAEL